MIVRTLRAELPAARYAGLIAAALAMRFAVSGGRPASSQLAALAFAAMLAAIAAASRRRPATIPGNARQDRGVSPWRSVATGIAGAAVLIFFPYHATGFTAFGAHANTSLLAWSLLVSAVAVTEEIVFRGVLFHTVLERHGMYAAVLLCALAFAVTHVPLYGWRAVPLDVAVGVWLGAVRLWGGVGAAAVSHTLADLATGWMVI